MPQYRAKIYDRAGVERAAINLAYADDAEAIRMVAAHADGLRIEVWEGARLVHRFEATRPD